MTMELTELGSVSTSPFRVDIDRLLGGKPIKKFVVVEMEDKGRAMVELENGEVRWFCHKYGRTEVASKF
jgi:hypothetical protein